MGHAHIIFHPQIQIRAERVAEVCGISIERATRLLSQPDTRTILQSALERAFQETVDSVVKEMTRIPVEPVPAPRRDCTVTLPALPDFDLQLGL